MDFLKVGYRATMAPPSSSCDHYEVLGLPNSMSGRHITTQDIKQAYRWALLRHHPDKLNNLKPPGTSGLPSSAGAEKYTIDDISRAYKVLSDSRARAEFDRILRLQQQSPQGKVAKFTPQTGLEAVDLDDLDFDDTQNIWYRGCRCGDERGFVVTEEELERDAEREEVATGCRGCSLWLKVLYRIAYKD